MEDRITVAEFLEFELYYELALFLQIELKCISSYKQQHPELFASAVVHVLKHNVSPQCRLHIKDKQSRRKSID